MEANLKQHENFALQAQLHFDNCEKLFWFWFLEFARCNYVPNSFFAGKKEAEDCRQKLTELLNYAKSIARLTPDLEKEFLEVCFIYSNCGMHAFSLF